MVKAAVHETVIGTVARVRKEQIRVSVRTSKGVKWLDIRVYYEAEDGSMRPSQRGVSLSPTEYTELRQVLQKLRREKDDRPAAATADLPRVK
jgi:Transcriptional Coactivator p15 (PC4)